MSFPAVPPLGELVLDEQTGSGSGGQVGWCVEMLDTPFSFSFDPVYAHYGNGKGYTPLASSL